MHSLIRETKREDAEQVMLLSHQLGYSISLQQTLQNIEQLLSTTDNCCYVAVLHNEVVGWTHAFKAVRIESNPFVEIGGLVVKDAARGKGIGKELINHVKQWSIEKNIFVLRLRCNTKRKDSHLFYEHIGFIETKEQKVFEMDITN